MRNEIVADRRRIEARRTGVGIIRITGMDADRRKALERCDLETLTQSTERIELIGPIKDDVVGNRARVHPEIRGIAVVGPEIVEHCSAGAELHP